LKQKRTKDIFLLLGTNLGAKLTNLNLAYSQLALGGLEMYNKSSVYESAPWGLAEQDAFLNQVLQCSWQGSPMELLLLCQKVERILGRVRDIHWGPRIIDIDILYFSNVVIYEPSLKVPHPSIAERRFTLIPLIELAIDFVHPIIGISNLELLNNCKDELEVGQIFPHNPFSIS
jgi:2-amino-4-hydroxy-6-hydroxymethyldihydropteridine diphosphokinase